MNRKILKERAQAPSRQRPLWAVEIDVSGDQGPPFGNDADQDKRRQLLAPEWIVLSELLVMEDGESVHRVAAFLTKREAQQVAKWTDHASRVIRYVPSMVQRQVKCKFCGGKIGVQEANKHQNAWVCPSCWDERLRTTA